MLTVQELINELQRLMDDGEIMSHTPVMMFNNDRFSYQKLTILDARVIGVYSEQNGLECRIPETLIVSLRDEGDE